MSWQQAGSIWNADSPNYREEWRTKQRNQAHLLFLSETEWSLIHTCEMKVSPTLFAMTLGGFSFFQLNKLQKQKRNILSEARSNPANLDAFMNATFYKLISNDL